MNSLTARCASRRAGDAKAVSPAWSFIVYLAPTALLILRAFFDASFHSTLGKQSQFLEAYNAGLPPSM